MSSMRLAAPSLAPFAFMPASWPVAEPELLMGYIGSIMVIRIGGALTSNGFERYLDEWTRSVDARPAEGAVFVMYDMPEWPGLTGVQHKQWGAMLKSREEKLRRTTRGMVLASASALTRGGARSILRLAPPPYPHAVVDTPRAAFLYIAERGGPTADAATRAYDALVRRHWHPGD
jgi:hypothetical protein